eukprot:TRINITY_DN2306_c0_g1_i3.p1 TRINITY_DN2306_c0_g1~~TRINITY_DN2306_c0_g1_i3.p1  ORF type:complete len:485 (-),score=141.75 TRINITY_DN2306_c0_g1_i3:114-1568(-)
MGTSDANGQGIALMVDLEGNTFVELSLRRRAVVKEFKKKLYVDIREYYKDKRSGDSKPGKKGIFLTPQHFETICEAGDQIQNALKDRNMAFELELDEKKFVTLSDFRNNYTVDIREFYTKDGNRNPTRKGVNLEKQELDMLIQHGHKLLQLVKVDEDTDGKKTKDEKKKKNNDENAQEDNEEINNDDNETKKAKKTKKQSKKVDEKEEEEEEEDVQQVEQPKKSKKTKKQSEKVDKQKLQKEEKEEAQPMEGMEDKNQDEGEQTKNSKKTKKQSKKVDKKKEKEEADKEQEEAQSMEGVEDQNQEEEEKNVVGKRSRDNDDEEANDEAAPSNAKRQNINLMVDLEGNTFVELSLRRRAVVKEFKKKLYVDIREYYQKSGDSKPGKKGIFLTPQHFETICEAGDQIQNALKDRNMAFELELDQKKFVTLSDFRNNYTVDIREFYTKDGNRNPTRKGINLDKDELDKLLVHGEDLLKIAKTTEQDE